MLNWKYYSRLFLMSPCLCVCLRACVHTLLPLWEEWPLQHVPPHLLSICINTSWYFVCCPIINYWTDKTGKGERKKQWEGKKHGEREREREKQRHTWNSDKLSKEQGRWLSSCSLSGNEEEESSDSVCNKCVLRFSFCFPLAVVLLYSMEDTQVARTIELNDGTQMPVLGLGTWKVASTLITNVCFSSRHQFVFLHTVGYE